MQPHKILWVNPSFLDYRVPLYKELYDLSEGNFYLVYSKDRVPQRCVEKIDSALGDHALGLPHERQIRIGGKGDFANTGVSIPFPKGLYRLIKSVDADIIIAEGFFQFTPWALFRSITKHIPLMIAYERTAHTERDCPWWRKVYRKLVNKFVSGYIANGILTKEYLVSQGVKPDSIFTGGMCADSKQLSIECMSFDLEKRSALKQSLGIKENGLIYIYVGQLIERKGVIYLLDAWREHHHRYPHDSLLIVGTGPLGESYIHNFGSGYNILFTGGIDYSEIYKYYAISDVFVIPTLEDNWSLVVPEAMSCGLPIACSIYNGCYPELVQEGRNGVLFDPLKKQTIEKALAIFHSVDLKRYGEESKLIEQYYNPQQTAQNIYNAVTAILNENTTRP